MDISKLSGVMQQAQQRFQKADANADGAISRAEFDQAQAANGGAGPSADQVFNSFDADNDGQLTQDELRAGVQAKIKAAVQAGGPGGGPRGAGFAGGGAGGVQTDIVGSLLQTEETEETDETDAATQYDEQIQDALNEDPRVKWLSFNGLVNKVV